ncbi:MAG: UvrD-helicase domain-containing protein, partial [Steroidobacteraceae bacterium]|nr:UvrD-helicase domain-containing protein [Steroidobacteraceae bacterium]
MRRLLGHHGGGLMPTSDSMQRLNAAQREAATHGEARPGGVVATPLLVIAGAGTGKTNTLAHRVGALLLNGV